MKLSQLRNIVKESLKEIQKEQTIPGSSTSSCHLPLMPNGPYPAGAAPDTWKTKWELFKNQHNLGCNWVNQKHQLWSDKLNLLRTKPFPNCRKKHQAYLQYKIKHVTTNYSNCI